MYCINSLSLSLPLSFLYLSTPSLFFSSPLQVLIKELQSHESVITSLSHEGNELLRTSHFATEQIQQALQKLTESWDDLNQQAEERRRSLDDSLHLQQVRNT